MKKLMKKKPILLKNFRKDQGSRKESFPSNFLIVAELGTFKPSVLISRKTLKMNMKKNNTIKRENSTIRKLQRKKEFLLKRRRQQFI